MEDCLKTKEQLLSEVTKLRKLVLSFQERYIGATQYIKELEEEIDKLENAEYE